MKERQVFQGIEIIDISTEGKGIGRVNNIVCFIDFAVPGDVVDIEITKKKSNYREGRVTQYQKLSEKRTEPVCKHFGTCGGCKWQNINYENQLFYKQKYVVDALTRIGNITLSQNRGERGEILPIIPSKNIFNYRNKLEFTFSNKKWLSDINLKPETWNSEQNGLGFHIPKLFDKVLDIEHCHLQQEPSNAIRLEMKKYALENNLSFFDIRKQNGFLRNLIIRNSSIGQWMVVIAFFYEDKPLREKLLNHISQKFPAITSLQYVINSKPNDSIADLQVKPFKGEDCIYEEMPLRMNDSGRKGLKFRISPKSFFQTNSAQATELYNVTLDFADLNGNETVYDLYTGTGTIANFVAPYSKHVIGIEYVSEAIEDAKMNSQINNIANTEFFAGDIKDALSDPFIYTHGKPDVIITDPPRAGMHADVVKKIFEIAPRKIIYVSCNPATQARDIALLNEKYFVEKVQPVDMFPHTAHVESVVKLVLK